MVAFVTSILVLILGVAAVVPYSRRRPVGRPLTWGEAFLAATYVFFLMFWAYGVVPHQWLTWADGELEWRADRYFFGWGGIIKPQAFDGWLPFTITKAAVRDIVATLIYVVLLGVQVAMWMYWQNRGEKKTAPVEISAYGRPLVKSGSAE